MNTTSNATDFGLIYPVGRYIAVTFYSICAILILVCNTFTLYILQTCRNAFMENTCLFFKALAIVDMVGGLFGYFVDLNFVLSTASIFDWISGHFCTVLPALYFAPFNQTLAILCCINLDRLLVIVWPLRYPILATPKRAKIALVFALIVPVMFTVFLWPIPGFPGTDIYRLVCRLNGQVTQWSDFANLNLSTRLEPSWIIMLVPAAITIMVTTFSNIYLMLISCRHIRKMNRTRDLQPVNNEQRNTQDNMKGVRTVLLITCFCYTGIGLWLFTVMYIYPRLGRPKYTVPFIIGGIVELSTRWWNCLIYLSTSQTFRDHAKKAIKRICRRRNNQIII